LEHPKRCSNKKATDGKAELSLATLTKQEITMFDERHSIYEELNQTYSIAQGMEAKKLQVTVQLNRFSCGKRKSSIRSKD
jgi:hypothetical protein